MRMRNHQQKEKTNLIVGSCFQLQKRKEERFLPKKNNLQQSEQIENNESKSGIQPQKNNPGKKKQKPAPEQRTEAEKIIQKKKKEERDRGRRNEAAGNLLAGFLLAAAGITAISAPGFVFELILNVVIFYLFFNGVFKLLGWYWSGFTRKSDLINGLFTLSFGAVLIFYGFLPEWIIRTCFGWYALFAGTAMLVQNAISFSNGVRVTFLSLVLMIGYLALGVLVLFTPRIPSWMLMHFFGMYLLLLGFRFLVDAFDGFSRHYGWKRMVRISLPPMIAALILDYALSQINAKLMRGQDYQPELPSKDKHPALLKAMVHIGPEGIQKVGHFSFAWKGLVYSYGNYDAASGRMFGLLGDGVYFNVELERYLKNICRYERNTIFEFSIAVSKEQEESIEEKLQQIRSNAYRWYCPIEKASAYANEELYEKDYPSRLHYRTGAKFYKIRKGKFKTYWVTGDNCVSFSDVILGSVGADVLSMRGIITPGTYFDYLNQEYAKENSPVVDLVIHPAAELAEGI